MLKFSLGLDVSAKDIHCCLSAIDHAQQVKVKSTRKISNNKKGFTDLSDWINRNHPQKEIPLVICMEATGIYYENCAMFLYKAGYAVSVILPNKAKKYLQASGQKSKNDKIDAKGLAQMGAEKSLTLWQPMGEFFYQLREVTRQSVDLQQIRNMIKNRIHSTEQGMYINKEVLKQLKSHLKLIDKQLKDGDKQIESLLSKKPEVAEKVKNICLIKGLGIKSVATVLAETNGFELFRNARQLVSFAGYDTVENQSGSHVGKTRISKKGNSHIRRILFMPAFSVVMHNVKPFIDLYNRTLPKHNIKMKSYVAVQKKLLTTIFALWKSGEPFDENYGEKNNKERDSALTGIPLKAVVPAKPALHKVSIPRDQSPSASSGKTKV